MEAVIEMPKYKCNKIVHALKVSKTENVDVVGYVGTSTRLFFEEKEYAPILTPKEWSDKHSPEVGGYYVVYKDGYKSFSPAKAFEEGYTKI